MNVTLDVILAKKIKKFYIFSLWKAKRVIGFTTKICSSKNESKYEWKMKSTYGKKYRQQNKICYSWLQPLLQLNFTNTRSFQNAS